MGRHAGWLTAASALARKYVNDNPLLIYSSGKLHLIRKPSFML